MSKGGGGKLSRSETVTVRLDPKMRYLAELAARLHRRTLSSYVEWAIQASLEKSAEAHVAHDSACRELAAERPRASRLIAAARNLLAAIDKYDEKDTSTANELFDAEKRMRDAMEDK